MAFCGLGYGTNNAKLFGFSFHLTLGYLHMVDSGGCGCIKVLGSLLPIYLLPNKVSLVGTICSMVCWMFGCWQSQSYYMLLLSSQCLATLWMSMCQRQIWMISWHMWEQYNSSLYHPSQEWTMEQPTIDHLMSTELQCRLDGLPLHYISLLDILFPLLFPRTPSTNRNGWPVPRPRGKRLGETTAIGWLVP